MNHQAHLDKLQSYTELLLKLRKVTKVIFAADKKLFRQITSNRHCLHSLLPRLRHTKALNSLRSRGHNYQLPQIQSEYFPKQMSFFHTFKLVLVSLIVSRVIFILSCISFFCFCIMHLFVIVMCALVVLLIKTTYLLTFLLTYCRSYTDVVDAITRII